MNPNSIISPQEWLMERFPSGGFFVEAGAHDGVGDSQSLLLEQAGWKGVCCEASCYISGLRASRCCIIDDRCLWDKDGEQVIFREVHSGNIELSGVKECLDDQWNQVRRNSGGKDVVKNTVSLTTMLNEHKAPAVIEFLCLDTEGSEVRILRAHDFQRFLFLTLLVEHNGIQSRLTDLLLLLEPLGYRLANNDGKNLFLLHESLP